MQVKDEPLLHHAYKSKILDETCFPYGPTGILCSRKGPLLCSAIDPSIEESCEYYSWPRSCFSRYIRQRFRGNLSPTCSRASCPTFKIVAAEALQDEINCFPNFNSPKSTSGTRSDPIVHFLPSSSTSVLSGVPSLGLQKDSNDFISTRKSFQNISVAVLNWVL